MGIYVKAILLPFEVTDEQWEDTYTEALKLINAYDFLDKIEDRERFSKLNLTWHYCIKSREREIDGQIGVAISGAFNGCIRAEENTLYKNLDSYKLSRKGFFGDIHTATKPEGKLCNDALFDVCPENDWLSEYQDYVKMVFWGKTQGYDHHNYLLAIALLFEDRLGKAFTVYGDIARGQIKAAIEWANQHLDTPILMPARMDNAQLLTRLSAFVPREHLLNAFMNLIYSPKNEEMNEFINKCFTHEEIATYWAGEISHCAPGTIGSSRFFLRYFDMNSDLELLTRICLPKFTLQEYVKDLASIKVFEAEKNTDNPIASDPDRETPEPIEVVMGKMMVMGLSNNVTKRYISLEQGITELNDALTDIDTDDTTDVKSLLKAAMKERLPQAEKLSDSIKRFNETLDSVTRKHESVDICDPEDLVFFKQRDTLDGDVERNLQAIREFVDNHRDNTTELYTKTHSNEGSQDKAFSRTAIIIELNRRLLPLTTWNFIEQNVEDDKFYFTLLTLLSLKSDTLPMGHYVRGLLTNPMLFQHVLLK